MCGERIAAELDVKGLWVSRRERCNWCAGRYQDNGEK